MAAYIVPPIGSKGAFTFKAPFNGKEYKNVELEVTGIRLITELIKSNLKPYEGIYEPNKISEAEYQDDVTNKMPIVIFKATSGKQVYIPANRIDSYPDITGVKYQEKILAITLGQVPVSMDLTKVKEIIRNEVEAQTGITSTVEVVDASAVLLVNRTDDATYLKLLAGKRKERKSDRIMYLELLEKYNALKKQYDGLNKCIKANLAKLKPPANP